MPRRGRTPARASLACLRRLSPTRPAGSIEPDAEAALRARSAGRAGAAATTLGRDAPPTRPAGPDRARRLQLKVDGSPPPRRWLARTPQRHRPAHGAVVELGWRALDGHGLWRPTAAAGPAPGRPPGRTILPRGSPGPTTDRRGRSRSTTSSGTCARHAATAGSCVPLDRVGNVGRQAVSGVAARGPDRPRGGLPTPDEGTVTTVIARDHVPRRLDGAARGSAAAPPPGCSSGSGCGRWTAPARRSAGCGRVRADTGPSPSLVDRPQARLVLPLAAEPRG